MRARRTLHDLTAAMVAAYDLVAPDTCWLHYKGQKYHVVSLAYNEKDLEVVVVYEPAALHGVLFVCPLSRWLEIVTHRGRTVGRFTAVE